MATTPQSSFAEAEARQRELAERCAEVQGHVAALAETVAAVQQRDLEFRHPNFTILGNNKPFSDFQFPDREKDRERERNRNAQEIEVKVEPTPSANPNQNQNPNYNPSHNTNPNLNPNANPYASPNPNSSPNP